MCSSNYPNFFKRKELQWINSGNTLVAEAGQAVQQTFLLGITKSYIKNCKDFDNFKKSPTRC